MLRKLRVTVAGAIAIGMASTLGAAAQTSDVITIGYTGPLSGGAAAYGTDVQHGLQMAIDELNEGGGIKLGNKKATFKLVSLDDAYRPPNAVANAKQLAQQDNAPIVFCPHSGGILAIEAFNDKTAPKFLLGAYTSEPAILKQGDSLMVMTPPSYDQAFKPYTAIEMKRFGKRLGLLATTTAYGNAWAKGFRGAWEAAGGTVTGDYGVDYNTTTDFSGAVTKALADKPDVLLVGGPSQPTGLVIKAARNQGYKGGFVLLEQAKFEQVEAVAPMSELEGAIDGIPFADYNGPALKPFIAAYDKKFGSSRAPNAEVGLNYETMHVFAQAISEAGSTDPAAIMAKMPSAAKDLPAKYRVSKINGLSKAGHLLFDIPAAIVDHGKYVIVSVPFTE